jgi:hypothetical protein
MLQAIHPNIFHTYPQSAFQSVVDSIKGSLTDSLNAPAFYLRLTSLFQLESDGHTFLNFPLNVSEHLAQAQGVLFFPFKVLFQNRKIYLIESYQDTTIVPFSQLISINGISAKQIVRDMEQLESFERYEALEPYMSYFFKHVIPHQYGWAKTFTLELKSNGITQRKSVNGIPLDSFPKKPFKAFDYSLDSTSSTAVLDLNSCSNFGEFPDFCTRFFESIHNQKLSHLIIDLRGNTGGSTKHGDYLLPILTNKAVTQYPQILRRHTQYTGEPIDTSFMKLYDDNLAQATEHHPLRFDGNVFVLTDAITFSSASVLAATLQCYGIGVVVGQETGGTQIFFDEPYEYYLPHSQLFVGISTQKYWSPCGTSMKHGVIPDYPTSYSLDDLESYKDLEMEKVHELTSRQKRD